MQISRMIQIKKKNSTVTGPNGIKLGNINLWMLSFYTILSADPVKHPWWPPRLLIGLDMH